MVASWRGLEIGKTNKYEQRVLKGEGIAGED